MADEKPRECTNPPQCTCQYLTVGNHLTTHNAVDSSRCRVHGPLSALEPATPSAMHTCHPSGASGVGDRYICPTCTRTWRATATGWEDARPNWIKNTAASEVELVEAGEYLDACAGDLPREWFEPMSVALAEYRRMGHPPSAAELVIVEGQRDRYREALDEIVTGNVCDAGGCDAHCRDIARQALAEIGQPARRPTEQGSPARSFAGPYIVTPRSQRFVAGDLVRVAPGDWPQAVWECIEADEKSCVLKNPVNGETGSFAQGDVGLSLALPTADGMSAEELLNEVHRWRHCVAYWLGNMARTATPEDCRAEGMRRSLEEGEERLRMADAFPAWKDHDDKPLPEDDKIAATFPTESKRHDLYAEAMRLVGSRSSKGGLVALVNWLLHERERAYDEGIELGAASPCGHEQPTPHPQATEKK